MARWHPRDVRACNCCNNMLDAPVKVRLDVLGFAQGLLVLIKMPR